MMKKPKSHMEWSWVILIGFLLVSIIDARFGILGVICIATPLYHAFRGRGKVHCSHYCPRGSLLGKMLARISLQNNMPAWLRGKTAKNALLSLMLIMFGISLYHAGFNYVKISFAIFRLMSASLVLGIVMGVIFKPRSWCQVCPMGYGTGIIKNYKDIQDMKNKSVDIEINKQNGKITA